KRNETKRNDIETNRHRLMQGVASALDHMHRHRVVHVDVKPDNVFLRRRPRGGYTPKLGDLGLALGE
ncbi:unnamed protein product, partial [Laminaria digitata]